jgi:hypothetical protein
MSKYELQEQALHASGVSVEKSQEAIELSPSLYARLGTAGFKELSTLFYNRVFDDDQPWFLSIFSSSTKAEAIENQVSLAAVVLVLYKKLTHTHTFLEQYPFFVQTFGGPDLYRYVIRSLWFFEFYLDSCSTSISLCFVKDK